jgi:pimeloyl-ACP methyl ester carboxylesterase
MADLKHAFAQTNGIRMHYVEQGNGPLMVLCHGWPESWYSWRHQIASLTAAGYRVVAPDQRGYGQTDRPEPIESYNILNLVGDIVGLVNALGEKQAVIAGHDWGAMVVAACAVLRSDMFRGVALLSVPYIPRAAVRPAEMFRIIAQQQNFYQDYFQQPGKVEKELEEDVRKTMLGTLYSASGDAPPGQGFPFVFDKSKRLIDSIPAPDRLPSWLSEQDLDFFVSEFKRSGFRGGINWYRNIDRNWELTPFLDGARILQPAIFVTGDRDLVLQMVPEQYKMLETNMPNLLRKVLIPGAGHWIQQERPKEVTDMLVQFLSELPG